MSRSGVGKSSIRGVLVITSLLLIAPKIDWPWDRVQAAMESIRSREPNTADRQANEGGYYEGLINRGSVNDRARDELALRLLGEPERWISFHDMGATHYIPDSFIQFILRPNIEYPVLDHVFTTSSVGLRDHPHYQFVKPAGTFRIVLLGSSIDMGWGVPLEETYENRLEAWLNHQVEKRGLDRHFEIINFSMAAYSPAQRMERYITFANQFQPDLVLYSATMLDTRLTQIHLCDLLRYQADPTYRFVEEGFDAAGLTEADTILKEFGTLKEKDQVKTKLKPYLWDFIDGALGKLAIECRTSGTPLVFLFVPRAGLSDRPRTRMEGTARYNAIAERYAVPVLDLSDAFDDQDPVELAIAPWDDHPNAEGHQLLFYALADALLENEKLNQLLWK